MSDGGTLTLKCVTRTGDRNPALGHKKTLSLFELVRLVSLQIDAFKNFFFAPTCVFLTRYPYADAGAG